MNFRELISKLDKIEEAADPQKYADAQQMMANLEKAAQYTGDDEIVRSRMGLPPKLPPIEQWDGKMPQPIGKPDWFARLTSLGKATDDQATAVKQNAAISTSREFIDTNLAKLQDLVAKLGGGAAVKESNGYNFSFAKELVESFEYKTDEGIGSLGAKVIPGLGLAAGAYDAYQRAKAGDYTGAALGAGAGLASLVPGVGTAAALGLAGAQMGRDKAKTGEFLPDYDKIAASNAPAPSQSAQKDPKASIKQMQKELGVADDGIIGDKTIAALKANPKIAAKYKYGPNGKPLQEARTEGERIANLKNRLAEIESQQLDEGPLDLLKGAWNVGKNVARGFQGQAARTTAGQFTKAGGATNLGKSAATATKAIKANPGKAALGAAVAGTAAGYGATKLAGQASTPAKPQQSGQAATKPAATPAAEPAATPAATPAAPAGPTPEQQEIIKQIQAVMAQLADVDEQGVIKALGDAQAAIDKVGKPAPVSQSGQAAPAGGDSRTPAEIAHAKSLGDFAG